MNRVTIIGHFAFGLECLDGQTIKTKIISKELKCRFGAQQVEEIDTHGGIKTLFRVPLQVFRALRNSKNVIILPAYNGLRVYAPLLAMVHKIFKTRKLHYIVIGGWLPEFLKRHAWTRKSLLTFHAIYVETYSMKRALEEEGFTNVYVMPNSKDLKILSEDELVYQDSEPYRLCTFSRVMKQKGIEDAIKAVRKINKYLGKDVFELDIYGQVDDAHRNWFCKIMENVPKYIRYCGTIPFSESTNVLKEYYVLLFPTYYAGEGFAGTLIDALFAGLPVIASDWKYNAEIVEDFKTGLIYPVRNIEALIDKLYWIYEHQDKCNEMRVYCLKKAKEYLPKNVLNILISQLN